MVWHNEQVSRLETEKILEIARECLNIPGDFVEMGCYKGDTSLMLADLLSGTGEELWIYDSFEGLPRKSIDDESVLGEDFRAGELYVTKREVKERFLRAGIKLPIIKKAWFNELTREDLPGEIAFAFLDGDFYESIRDSLLLVESKMVKGGVIMVHDYDNAALPGVAKAVNEWNEKYGHKVKKYESMAIIKV